MTEAETKAAPRPLLEGEIRAHVAAQWLPLVGLFMDYDRNVYSKELFGFYIVPREAGGVEVVATDGHVLIVVTDPNGHASGPVFFVPSVDLLDGLRLGTAPQVVLTRELLSRPAIATERIAFDLEVLRKATNAIKYHDESVRALVTLKGADAAAVFFVGNLPGSITIEMAVMPLCPDLTKSGAANPYATATVSEEPGPDKGQTIPAAEATTEGSALHD